MIRPFFQSLRQRVAARIVGLAIHVAGIPSAAGGFPAAT